MSGAAGLPIAEHSVKSSPDAMQEDSDVSPINALPPVITALFIIMIGIEAMFALGERGIIGGDAAFGWRVMAVETYGFNGQILDWMLINGVYPVEHLIRLVAYLFVHANFTHMIFVGIMLLALGKMVGAVFTSVATLAVFILSGVFGALVYGYCLTETQWLIGGFPGVYGLIGAFTFLIWLRLRLTGQKQSKAFSMIMVLMGIQLVLSVFGGSNKWLADAAGFVGGFGLSFFVCPGGWRKI